MALAVRSLAAPLLALLVAAPAGAEVYRWTDEHGGIHFTQSLDQVPARYREAARASASQSQGPAIQTFSAPTPSPARTTRRVHRRGPIEVPFQHYGRLMKVDALVNDHLRVPFLIDSGASGLSLPAAVVERLGIRVGPETPRAFVGTANGVIQVPLVRIDSVTLGGAHVEGLTATVNPTMSIGLLGGDFLNNFVYSVDKAAGVITFERNDNIVAGMGAEQWRARFNEVRETLGRLETYLEETEIKRKGRRAELEQRLAELRTELHELEVEADRLDVPGSWRH